MNTTRPFPVVKHELVYAKVDNINKNTFKFQFIETLKNKKIVGLAFHPAQYLTRTPEGDALVPSATCLPDCYLTLKTTNGDEKLNKLPLYTLAVGVATGGTYEKLYPIDQVIPDWEQSYITKPTGGAALVVNQVFMLSVAYIDGESTCATAK